MNNKTTTAPLWRILLDAIPLTAVAVSLALWLAENPFVGDTAPRLKPIAAQSVLELEQTFAQAGYNWPPEGAAPALALQQLPPDLSELPPAQRKSIFFGSLTPLVLAENESLQRTRQQLESLFQRSQWSPAERELVAGLAQQYAVEGDFDDPAVRERLLARVDIIPLGLALAQAAKESGWGTSRFAQQARNLFGIWTWNAEQGMVPLARAQGAKHFVRVFPDLRSSVRTYLHTLNTGAVYEPLRRRRAELRAQGMPISSLELAAGLEGYSERGWVYVEEVRALIRSNRLHEYDDLVLAY